MKGIPERKRVGVPNFCRVYNRPFVASWPCRGHDILYQWGIVLPARGPARLDRTDADWMCLIVQTVWWTFLLLLTLPYWIPFPSTLEWVAVVAAAVHRVCHYRTSSTTLTEGSHRHAWIGQSNGVVEAFSRGPGSSIIGCDVVFLETGRTSVYMVVLLKSA